MATTDVLDRHEWKFTPVEHHFETLDGADAKQHFVKWDMAAQQALRFRFDQSYKRGMADDFIHSFFNCPTVRALVQVVSSGGRPASLGSGTAKDVDWAPLECTATSMDFFERLMDGEVVRAGGAICRMQDDFKSGGVTISDRLRQLFMDEENSDSRGMFTEDEKSEFLYHVMHRVVSGGAMMQYEDDYGVYKDVAKGIYKDMIAVQRNPSSGDIEPACHVYQVKSLGGTAGALFGRPDFENHNYCYLVINPLRREVTYWYGGFASAF
eukprot:TRINITY_DN10590_c0_g1_i1.p1 TRINITY_DN10590_c0_g1~~TRINITY_DN10590_c0_g1_i1.p1  ORF type:complete len:267 (+),score=113.70 TRINITY_DN10590_c0_g1_i1:60-860(+)